MAPKTFLTLPPEIRGLIYEHAYTPKLIEAEPTGQRYYPRAITNKDELDAISSPADLVSELTTIPDNPLHSTFKAMADSFPARDRNWQRITAKAPTTKQRVRRGQCRGRCAGSLWADDEFELPRQARAESESEQVGMPYATSRRYCWECADDGRALLYTCRQVYNESISTFYAQSTLLFSSDAALLRFIYCARTHGNVSLISNVALWFDCFYPTDFLCAWKEGALRQALPSLREVTIRFAESFAPTEQSGSDLLNVEEIHDMGQLVVRTLLKDDQTPRERLKVGVEGLVSHETTRLLEEAVEMGDVREWNQWDFIAAGKRAVDKQKVAREEAVQDSVDGAVAQLAAVTV